MDKRTIARIGMIGALASSLSVEAAEARDLTVVSFGGSLQDAVHKAFVAPFAAASGTPVKEDTYDGSLSKVSAQIEAKSINWDVVDVESNELRQGCEEGYFETLDWSKIAKPDFVPGAATTSDCGIGYMTGAVVLGYNGAKLANGPATWADFWDVKKFPGKRGLKFGPKWTLELALMADGVPADKVYDVLAAPGGVDRAFKKLDEIKPSVAWWKLGAESVQMLASGEVSMVAAYNGRIVAANRDEHHNYKMAWNAGSVYFLDYLTIVKGSPNAAAAMAFIGHATSVKPQQAFPTFIGYGPSNMKAFDGLPAQIAADLPTKDDMSKAVLTSDKFWLDHGDELTQRFSVWAAKS